MQIADIYEQTRGGLDIILAWCPDAQEVYSGKRKTFRFDDADTKPACTLREHGGLWYVKNFGESDPSLNAFAVVQKIENCDFGTAIRLVEERLSLVDPDTGKVKKLGADYRADKPGKTEPEGWYEIVFEEKFTAVHLKTIFSLNIWSKLGTKAGQFDEERAIAEGSKVCAYFNFRPVKSYSWVSRAEGKGLTKHTMIATETYPIFAYDEDGFQKLYCPKDRDPARRFRYFGEKPRFFMHGLDYVKEVVAAQRAKDENEYDADDPKKPEPFKVDHLIICSGGSDAMNVFASSSKIYVVWKNSENDKIDAKLYDQLQDLARNVYVLYDSDAAGKKATVEMCLQFIDLKAIYLPEFSADTDRDWRGKTYKDVRDYFTKYKAYEFEQLLKVSYPLQFWEESFKFDAKKQPVIINGVHIKKYAPLPTLTRNFLYRNGFCRLFIGLDDQGTRQWEYVHIQGNIVKRVTPSEMREFVFDWTMKMKLDFRLMDALSRTTDMNDQQLSLLPEVELEFEDTDARGQYFFFKNETWRVTREGIEKEDNRRSTRFVWSNEVIKHKIKEEEPFFRIYRDENEMIRIEILRKDCLFFRYLINASRIHWRKELEDRLDEKPEADRPKYREEYQFAIDGPLLDDEEIQEQMQHLVNKITAFGYCLHRYKNKVNATAIWSMDYVMDDPEKSAGGTGKSMSAESLTYLMPVHTLNGRNEDEIKDRFKFEGVTKHTDLVWLDDAYRNTPFDEFFSMITNFMTVPRKGQKTLRLSFQDSPKLYITSNYTPTKIDSSTWRRLWFTAYSDYYHANAEKMYREARRPFDDFGKQLFADFTEAEWNHFYNFMSQCVKTWLEFGRVDTPKDDIRNNTYRQKIGKDFMEWADLYFDTESGLLDAYVPRYKAFHNYEQSVKNSVGDRLFKEKLEMWAEFRGYKLNPSEVQGYRVDGRRITQRAVKETYDAREGTWVKKLSAEPMIVEFVYIQTAGTDLKHYNENNVATPTATAFAGKDDMPF